MPVRIVRVMFLVACVIMGVIWARYITDPAEGLIEQPVRADPVTGLAVETPVNQLPWLLVGGTMGAGASIGVMLLLRLISQDIFEKMSPALVAIVLAMVMGYAIAQYILLWWPNAEATLRVFVVVTLLLMFGFTGISLGLTRASNWESLIDAVRKGHDGYRSPKIVDTSVIIDGRIADVCKSGFLEGTLIIPRFVLKELQNIADSADVLRRAKGRRGLDMLKEMQESADKVTVSVVEDDPEDISEVDGKIVSVARDYKAKIITNDFNLNKVAQIEGIPVLNINDLANALKPAVLPDEQMEVKIIKEGKEAYQGVGYLDDGTMIVVDGGRDLVGKTVAVVVTSVLQTAAGRMIFTKLSHVLS